MWEENLCCCPSFKHMKVEQRCGGWWPQSLILSILCLQTCTDIRALLERHQCALSSASSHKLADTPTHSNTQLASGWSQWWFKLIIQLNYRLWAFVRVLDLTFSKCQPVTGLLAGLRVFGCAYLCMSSGYWGYQLHWKCQSEAGIFFCNASTCLRVSVWTEGEKARQCKCLCLSKVCLGCPCVSKVLSSVRPAVLNRRYTPLCPLCLVTLELQSHWRWFNTSQLICKQHTLRNRTLFCLLSHPVHCSLTLFKELRKPSRFVFIPSLVSVFLCSFLSPFSANWTPSSTMPRCWTTWLEEMRDVSWWPSAAGN